MVAKRKQDKAKPDLEHFQTINEMVEDFLIKHGC